MPIHGVTPPGLGREERIALTALLALAVTTAAWWALALWPVSAAPAWLERTRYACFGTTESGLPDAGGWVGLIGGPLGMLVIIAFGWGRGVLGLLRAARRSASVAAALASLVVLAALLVTGATVRVRQAAAATVLLETADLPPATYPRLDRPAPALALVSQHGDTVDLAKLRGRPALVTFAYAHCTTVCPVVVKHALDAQAALAAAGTPTAVLIVTLDPWRDTPSRLPALAESWALPAEDAWVLSGEVPAVEAALDSWEIPRTRDEVTGEVTHPALVYVIDRDGRIAFASNGTAATIAALVARL